MGLIDEPFILLFFGKSATGKSFYAKKLSDQLKIPKISLDDIKEKLFDLSPTLSDTSTELLNNASFQALTSIAREFALARQSIILDVHTKEPLGVFENIAKEAGVQFFAIELVLPDESMRFERYNHRIKSGQRQVGHQDQLKSENSPISHYPRSTTPDKIIDTAGDPDEVFAQIAQLVL